MKTNREVLISAKNVKKSAGGTDILLGINLEIFAGDFTVIMGASGSGKSTLLYSLSGMDKATSGTIFYKDTEISSASEKQLARLRATEFSFVFQQMHLVSNLTLLENMLVAGYASECASRKERAKIPSKEMYKLTAALVQKMGLEKAAKKFPSQVSGGESQRAAIARAIVSHPKILFADEPTGSLNKANSDEVLKLFSALNVEGLSILMVTHDKNAALCGNRILYLEDGRIRGGLNFETADKSEREKMLEAWLKEMEW